MITFAFHLKILDIPADAIDVEEQEKEARENEDPDKRISIMASDKAVHRDNEFYDSGEEDGVGVQAPPKGTKTNKDAHSFRTQSKRARLEESERGDVAPVDAEDSTDKDKSQPGGGDKETSNASGGGAGAGDSSSTAS